MPTKQQRWRGVWTGITFEGSLNTDSVCTDLVAGVPSQKGPLAGPSDGTGPDFVISRLL